MSVLGGVTFWRTGLSGKEALFRLPVMKNVNLLRLLSKQLLEDSTFNRLNAFTKFGVGSALFL